MPIIKAEKVREGIQGVTKERFDAVESVLKGFDYYSRVPKDITEAEFMTIKTVQYIKVMPWFLRNYGDVVCVVKGKTSASVKYNPDRRSGLKLYKESGPIAEEDMPVLTSDQYQLVELWPGINERNINDFLQKFTPEYLEIFRSNLQEGIIDEDEWEAVQDLVNKYTGLQKVIDDFSFPADASLAAFADEKDLPEMLVEATNRLNGLVEDGDVLILPGNTPQLIGVVLQKMAAETKPNLKIVSLGISGHPGTIMVRDSNHFLVSMKNTLTEEQHELYKFYMQDMGLTRDEIQGRKIHFLDVVNFGGGIGYLMQCLSEIAMESLENFNVINISPSTNSLLDGKFSCNGFEASYISLNAPTKLPKLLDAVHNDLREMRLMPNCSSYKWSSEFMVGLTEISRDMFGHAGEVFRSIFAEVDAILATSGVGVEAPELEAYDAGVECAPDPALTTENPEMDPSVVDLAGLNGPAAEAGEA